MEILWGRLVLKAKVYKVYKAKLEFPVGYGVSNKQTNKQTKKLSWGGEGNNDTF